MPANTEAGINGNTKHFFPRGKKNYNVLIDGRTFYDQPINDLIKHDKVKKVSTGQGDDYTTGCLLNHAYFTN